jgi:hypothetical protein
MNEREVARGFSALWGEFFPMLSPNFIIAFNEAYVQPIVGLDGAIPPVPLGVQTHHADVVAEFAFRLAAAANESNISVEAAASDDELVKRAHEAAVGKVRDTRSAASPVALELSDSERDEGVKLATVYEQFLASWPVDERVVFSPRVLGSGVLSSCHADLSIGETLYEVKTVSRQFQSRDLRQLLIYLALQAVTGEMRWQYGGLLNPRASVYCRFPTDWLVSRLSGGRPPRVVLADFVQALSRDAIVDRRF